MDIGQHDVDGLITERGHRLLHRRGADDAVIPLQGSDVRFQKRGRVFDDERRRPPSAKAAPAREAVGTSGPIVGAVERGAHQVEAAPGRGKRVGDAPRTAHRSLRTPRRRR